MKFMIDIPKQSYEDIKNDEWIDTEPIHNMVNAIKNGTPLSEELEKIKAEVLKAKPYYQYYIEKEDFILILDKHIAELKGETNDT